jgi:hypothetical protein
MEHPLILIFQFLKTLWKNLRTTLEVGTLKKKIQNQHGKV